MYFNYLYFSYFTTLAAWDGCVKSELFPGRLSAVFISLVLALVVLFYYVITLYIHFVPELN